MVLEDAPHVPYFQWFFGPLLRRSEQRAVQYRGRAPRGSGGGPTEAPAPEALTPPPSGALPRPGDGVAGNGGGHRRARELRRCAVRPDRGLGHEDLRRVEPGARPRAGGVERRGARLARRKRARRPARTTPPAPDLLRGCRRHQRVLGDRADLRRVHRRAGADQGVRERGVGRRRDRGRRGSTRRRSRLCVVDARARVRSRFRHRRRAPADLGRRAASVAHRLRHRAR